MLYKIFNNFNFGLFKELQVNPDKMLRLHKLVKLMFM